MKSAYFIIWQLYHLLGEMLGVLLHKQNPERPAILETGLLYNVQSLNSINGLTVSLNKNRPVYTLQKSSHTTAYLRFKLV